MNEVSKIPEGQAAETSPGKKKLSKKTLLVIVGAVVLLALIAAILFIPSKFERVKRECVQIAGQISSGKDYFTIDTYPDSYKNMSAAMKSALLQSTQENALKAIQYANREFGFPDSVYSQMLRTSALMGRQSEENSKYKVSWFYHPDEGLEVTYSKK